MIDVQRKKGMDRWKQGESLPEEAQKCSQGIKEEKKKEREGH